MRAIAAIFVELTHPVATPATVDGAILGTLSRLASSVAALRHRRAIRRTSHLLVGIANAIAAPTIERTRARRFAVVARVVAARRNVAICGTVLVILVLRADVVAALGGAVAAALSAIVRGEAPVEVEIATPSARRRYPTRKDDGENGKRQA